VVTQNAILGGYATHGHGREALKHLEQMCEEGVQPDDITFVCFCQLVAMQIWWMKACSCMLP